jgi:hypothetical protein
MFLVHVLIVSDTRDYKAFWAETVIFYSIPNGAGPCVLGPHRLSMPSYSTGMRDYILENTQVHFDSMLATDVALPQDVKLCPRTNRHSDA